MKEVIESRLNELKKEFESGQTMLQEIEQRQARLREQLFRINGAVQVLEEILAAPEKGTPPNIKEFQTAGKKGCQADEYSLASAPR